MKVQMCWNSSYTSNVPEQFLHFKCARTVPTLQMCRNSSYTSKINVPEQFLHFKYAKTVPMAHLKYWNCSGSFGSSLKATRSVGTATVPTFLTWGSKWARTVQEISVKKDLHLVVATYPQLVFLLNLHPKQMLLVASCPASSQISLQSLTAFLN